MPTYEYACSACGHQFEEFQSITAKPLTKCPECKKKKVKRLISAGAGFIFKGSGFYITDYRDKSYTEKAKAESGGGGGGESKDGESKSDAKPAAEKAASGGSESSSSSSSESKPAAPAPKSEPKPASKKKK